jgi:hypothetical protein
MRGIVLVLSLLAMCDGAKASSFVMLGGEPEATPSIVTMGEPARSPGLFGLIRTVLTRLHQQAQAEPEQLSFPSVIALGEPGVSDDTVAAIPRPAGPNPSPMVIRGGIVGGESSPFWSTAPASTARNQEDTPGSENPASVSASPDPDKDIPLAAQPR